MSKGLLGATHTLTQASDAMVTSETLDKRHRTVFFFIVSSDARSLSELTEIEMTS